MNKQILTVVILFLSITCYSQNCKEIESKLYNYQQAIKLIKSSYFTFSDKCNTSRSSWIVSAEYYSCDNSTGFLLIRTKRGKNYLHKNLPKKVWYQFKNTSSLGRFYNTKIKKKYQLMI